MELEVILPSNAEKIAPIFVTSPMNYNGGALLQRMACASDNGFCYGDNLLDEILSQIDWAFELVERHQNAKENEKMILQNALDRNPATWMPELGPPLDLYTASLMSVIYNLPHTAQHYALEQGRSVWMVGRAAIAVSRLKDMLGIFPQSKIIIIHRNPLDTIRDALRDRPTSDVRELCISWNVMMRDYLGIKSDRVLKILYESAQTNSEEFRNELEEFTGLQGTTDQIINTGSEAELPSSFELSNTLENQIKDLCADMLAVYYPHLTPDIRQD